MKRAKMSARKLLAYLAGQLLATCLPTRRARVERLFTIPGVDDEAGVSIVDRLIRYYLGHSHLDDPRSMEMLHRNFWTKQTPEGWYRFAQARPAELQVPLFEPIFERLGPTLRARGIERVCEFGCGDGRWLAWLARQWPDMNEYRGVDLSAAQIERNRHEYPHLQFDQGDLVEWAQSHARPKSLYLTHCGVLEYLSQDSVNKLLAALARRAPGSMVSFIEPIDASMYLVDDASSRANGDEFSWSHHYPGRLRAAGFHIEHQEEIAMDEHRMLVIIATVP